MKRTSKKNLTNEIAEELDIFDEMLTSLVELLEERGIITQEEFEQRIRKKIDKRKKSLSYREVQFRKK